MTTLEKFLKELNNKDYKKLSWSLLKDIESGANQELI